MPTLAETLAQAKAYHRAGQLPDARQLYQQILQADAAHVEAHYLLGVACHGLGQANEAVASLEQALRLQPRHVEAHNYLGAVLAQQGQLDEAISNFQQALLLRPDSSEISNNLRHALAVKDNNRANALAAKGKLAEAATVYQRALALKPDFAEAHNNLGAALAKQEKLDEAVACFRRALELKPDYANAHNNLGSVLQKQDKLDEAAACCRRALELKPDFADAHNTLAAVLRDQNKLDEAAACCRRALELKPDYAEAHGNLGAILAKQEKLDEAVAQYRRALELKPDYLDACCNLAAVALNQDRLDEAAACWRRALELKSDYAEAHNSLGAVLWMQDKLDEAAVCCRRALELKPDFADAHHTLGCVLERQELFDEAAACYRRTLELKPDFADLHHALGALLARQGRIAEARECFLKAHQLRPEQDVWKLNVLSLCPIVFNSSEDIEHFRRTLLRELEEFSQRELRFDLSALSTSDCTPPFNLQFHGHNDRPIREAYARLFRNCLPTDVPSGSSGRPRIGILLTDRHEKIFLKHMGGIVEHMDPDLFELIVIGSESGIGVIRSAIRNPALRLVGVPNKFDPFVAAIRDAQLDLLYYWEVGTDSINYFLPFLRLAPVQCTSWGMQVTSGIPQLDYYLSSELVEPEDARSHYTENLVLATTLLTYQRRVSLGSAPKPREYFGVSQEQHLYLCAQQLGKFHPDFDAILAGILRRDPKGVVVATGDRHGGFIADQLRRRFTATIGDVADRIAFIPLQPNADYLSLVAAADVLLDPLHFAGLNTSYDGFSLNQPIVTLPSRFERTRYTLGCYKKMGLSDCVASNPQQYIDIAVALGTDAEFRADVVEKIQRASSVLFEDMEAVREHERIFSALVAEARSGYRADAV